MAVDPLVQYVLLANSQGSGAAGQSALHCYLPHPSLAGNFLWLAISWSDSTGNNPTITSVVDDSSTGWTLVPSSLNQDAGNQQTAVYYRANCPSGVRGITVNWSAATALFVSGSYGEFSNCAITSPIDNSGNATKAVITTALTSWASGAVTTSANDAIILQVAFAFPVSGNFTKATGYTMLGADRINGAVAQYSFANTAGSNNPAITSATAAGGGNDVLTTTIAIKRDDTKGTPYNTALGPRIVRALWCDINSATGTSLVYQIPCKGKQLVSGTQLPDTATLSDSSNGAWTKTASATIAGGGPVRCDYKLNPIVDPNGLTLTISGSSGDLSLATALIYDVDSVAPLQFDAVAGVAITTGNQTSPANLSTVSITPSASGGIMFSNVGVNDGSMYDTVTPATYLGDTPWAPEWNGGENEMAQDDGWCHVVPTVGGTTYTPVYTNSSPTGGALGWAAVAIALIPVVVSAQAPLMAAAMRPAAHGLRGKVAMSMRALRFRVAPSTSAGPTAYTISLDGTTASAGAITNVTAATKGGTQGSNGALAKEGQLTKAGVTTSAGTIAKLAQLAKAGVSASSGALTRAIAAMKGGTMPSASALAKQGQLAKGGSTASTGTLAKAVGKPLAGTLGSSGTLSAIRAFLIALGGTMSSAGALAKQVGKPLAGATPSGGAITKAATKALGGIMASAGTLARRTAKALAGTLPSSGVVTITRVILLALSGTMGSAGTLTRRTSKGLSGTTASAGSLGKRIATQLAGVTASTGALQKTIARTFAGFMASAGALVARIMGLVPPVYPGGTFTPDAIDATFIPAAITATFVADDSQATFTPTPTE